MFDFYYKDRRVLVTGHTGFKGAWLSLWLKKVGAEVIGISLPAPTNPNMHEVISKAALADERMCDIRDLEALCGVVAKARPELVFHLAAQSIVRRSYAEPLETLSTNVVGTAHVLEAVRRAELGCPVVVITSD